MKTILIKQSLVFGGSLLLSSCTFSPQSPTSTNAFKNAFDCPADRGWVVLKRPNSLWDLGTVLEVTSTGAEDMGNIQSLSCFPADSWVKDEGETASASYSSTGKYGMSLASTLGLPKAELLKMNISVAGDLNNNEAPQQSIMFETQAAKEKRISYLKLEDYISSHYNDMSAACKRAFTTENRYLVDGVLQVSKGSFKVVNNQGISIDLSSPAYKTLQDAAIKAGYTISSSGSIVMNEDKPPMSVCVRARRFDGVLASIGASRGIEAKTFNQAMEKAGLKARQP